MLFALGPWRAQAASGKTYIVGSTATGVPFTFIDVKTNTLTGAMVDIMKAIAAEAGFQIDLRATAFGALIPSLTTKKIDIIAAAMLKTPARAKVVDFSEPVYSYGAGIVVPARGSRDYKSIEDLRGVGVGVQVGTRFFEQLQAAGVKEIKTYDNLMEMLGDLSVGRIGAAYGDAPIFAYQITQAKIKSARVAKEFQPPSVEDVCLVVRKGDTELLGRIDASVKRLKTTTIKAILGRWGLR
jgi:polar amino acid transport system substrate-binding protein